MTRNKFQCNKPLNGLCKKIILSAVVASSLVMAADVTKESALVTHTELGYIQTDGNTETKTFNLESKATKNWQKHVFAFMIDAQYAKDSGTATKNKFLTELTYDYEFTDRLAFTYLLGYKSDKFSSFDYQAYTGPGLKYTAIANKEHSLDFIGSILYSTDKYDDVVVASVVTVGESEKYSSYKVELNYVWQIIETVKFTQDLTYRSSFEDANNYFAFSKSALSTKISDIFSAGISYKVDYANLAPVGNERSDKTLAINLILDY